MVDGDDAAGVLHADLILDRAGNCYIEDELRLDGGAALTDLLLMRQPAVVDKRTRGGKLSVEQGGQLLQRLEIR